MRRSVPRTAFDYSRIELKRFSNSRAVAHSAQGVFFMGVKPLSGSSFGVQQLWSRCTWPMDKSWSILATIISRILYNWKTVRREDLASPIMREPTPAIDSTDYKDAL